MVAFEEYIRCERVSFRIWRVLGLWATKDETLSYRVFRLSYHFLFTIIYIFAMVTSCFYAENIEELWTDILFILLTMLAMFTKMVVIVRNFEKIYCLLKMTVSDSFKPQTEIEARILDDNLHVFSNAMLVYLSVTFSCLWAHLGFLFDDRYKLPFFSWFFWLPLGKGNPLNYYLIFVYQMFGMLGHCLFNASSDVQLGYLLLSGGLQLDILSESFARLPVPTSGKPNEIRYYQKTFQNQVDQYNRICRFIREIESTFTLTVFIQLCASGITICASVFRLSAISITDHLGSSIPIFFYLGAMLIQVFVPCYFGNEVTLKSQKLTNAVFSSGWYNNRQLKDQKNVKLLMQRFNEPIRLKAGHFFNYNLEAFMSTLNTAYSVYAVLNSKNRKG
ncbi:odorant receptor 94a-like [Uranotaenia lowii]|uniref:odorant receptor 94a-like n=1 Tax=Uranotaenia lowii TaxID=190385 RepID=UPI0024789E9E|nr:odorant receptor 94a-like [Uranotaenia lowii]